MKAQAAQRGSFNWKKLLGSVLSLFSGGARQEDPPKRKEPRESSAVGLMYTPGSSVPTQAQKNELEYLCNQLFRKKELITSGKLQLLGLAQVKRRMGKNWPALRETVYATVEAILKNHMVPGDFFVRYHDDTYILIFGNADFEEGSLRTAVIAEEIRKALFMSDNPALKGIGVAHSTGQSRASALAGKTHNRALDILARDSAEKKCLDGEKKSTQRPEPVRTTQVNAGWRADAAAAAAAEEAAMGRGSCSYFPLWEPAGNALSANLCHQEDPSLQGAPRDLRTQTIMAEELAQLKDAGEENFILCPVSYKTLSHQDSFARYLELCKKLPVKRREAISFMISDVPEHPAENGAFGFLSQLKEHCGLVCAQLPFSHKGGFQDLRAAGIEAVAFSLPDAVPDEAKVIKALTDAAQQAQEASFKRTFVTNISSRSLLMSLACMGFDYLGGTAIHKPAPAPVARQDYSFEQILTGCAKN